ncbi:hypothetical protein EKO27_g9573 [Xylaria grammica]|uniref:F-box domain-containing protein n=1 Tax=Xylaria grammica TaxID=363999 RepID=A0A439CTN9_9PEZI|nr:hypothetical protein EKO27_g9573 [Xylaria grammica]
MDHVGDTGTSSTTRDPPSLPVDLFHLLSDYLTPEDCIRCRRVGRRWNDAFSSQDLSRRLMHRNFPRAREMRNAANAPISPDWAQIYPIVARRYFHLRSARARRIERIDIDPKSYFEPVKPFKRWLQRRGKIYPFQREDPNWCMEDGLLIYRENVYSGYVAYDLETGRRVSVPFDGVDKTVRRLRLAHNVLVIEWCERPAPDPFILGNIYRHFATAFDVRRSSEPDPDGSPSPWTIRFRSEWKIHDLGFPKIEDASPYRPSEDPLGINRPGPWQPQPRVVKRFGEDELGFFDIRQGKRPIFREILLDEETIYIHEEDHTWDLGRGWPENRNSNHLVRATGIPLSGVGPRWVDICVDISPVGCIRQDIGRHELPRHLTVSDAVDWLAGVRIVARYYFGPADRTSFLEYMRSRRMRTDGRLEAASPTHICTEMEIEAGLHETEFQNDIWGRLLGKGKIVGDERWVVGAGWDGNITVVRF